MYNDPKVSGDTIQSTDWNNLVIALENTTTGHDHDGVNSKALGNFTVTGNITLSGSNATLTHEGAGNLEITSSNGIVEIEDITINGTAISGASSITSNNFTGNLTGTSILEDGVTATTQSAGNNSTLVATTAYVDAAISVEDMWDRTGTTISYKTSGDTLSIDGPFITSSNMTLSADSATITHNGATSLTIESTSGTVAVENITFTGDDITGANSITSTSFVGDLTGDCSGQAGTVATITGLAPDTATTAASQPNITSLGTLTTLTVDNITLNGSTITGITDANTVLTAYAGKAIEIEGVSFDGGDVTGIGSLGVTGTRVTTGFFTDLEVTNTITGSVSGGSGSSTYASALTITDDTTTNATMYPLWVTANTGNLPGYVSSTKLYFNASSGILTATGFSGDLTGDVTGNSATATLASTITVADTTSATCYVALWEAATGSLSAYSDAGLTYAADTGTLTATAFSGPLTGNVTGDCSGSSGSCTGNAATATLASTVTVAAESSDTSCSVLFATDSTGSLGVKSSANLTYNSSTGQLTAAVLADNTLSITGGAITSLVSISDGTASWSSNSLSGFTSISGTTLTDGTFSASSGAFTSVASISDGTASWSSNSLSGFTSISGTTITDGTFSASSGAFTSVTSISDGTASWSSNSLSGFTSISGTTVTDGTCSISSGAISGGTTIGCSGNITTSSGNVYATNGSLNTGDSDTAGSVVISDGSSNYITIDSAAIASDYTLTLPTTVGTANYALIGDGSGNLSWLQVLGARTMVLSAAGAWASTTNGASGATQLELGTNDVDIVTQDFDPDTNEYIQWTVAMPDNWDGSTVTAKFYWSHPAASAYNVIWGLQARAYANDDALDQAWGTAQTVTDSGGTTNDLYISADTSAITVGGSPAAGQLVQFRAYRNAADGSDTLDVDARLHSIKLEYGINALTS